MSWTRIILTVCMAFTVPVGCSRSTPVEEITVESSGMEIHDQETALANSDWPGWRGPDNSGLAQEQPIVSRWDKSTNIIWTADVPGRGHSSPVVVGGLVLITTALEAEQRQELLAYDAQTGEPAWDRVVHEGGFTKQELVHAKSSYANGTAACDGTLVFVAFVNADHVLVSAYDLSGNLAWQRDVGPFRSRYGYAPSPILYRSSVIVAADHMGGGYLAALDRSSGTIIWRTRRPRFSSYSSPIVAKVAGKIQLLISGCDEVASYDPETGKESWSCRGTTESTCGTMVTDGEYVFASGGYPENETICVRGDGTKDVVWRNRTGVYEPSMLLANDHLFTVTDEGIAHCWEAKSGDLKWRKRLGGSFSASPILCNGLILVPNLKGETFVFEADGSKYTQVAKNRLGDDCYTSFAVSDARLFTRVGVREGGQRREQLVCIGEIEE